jgi:hypothetical protein
VENECDEKLSCLSSVLIKKDSTTTQGLYSSKKERKIRSSEKFHDLVVVGTGGEKEFSHQRKVKKLRQMMSMRVARNKRVEELMTKREGTFLHKNIKAIVSNSEKKIRWRGE